MTGRVLDDVASAFAWTAEGRLASITKDGALVAMTYDADGHRTKKVYTPAAGATVTTIYATPMYEVRTFSDGTQERHTLHLFGAASSLPR